MYVRVCVYTHTVSQSERPVMSLRTDIKATCDVAQKRHKSTTNRYCMFGAKISVQASRHLVKKTRRVDTCNPFNNVIHFLSSMGKIHQYLPYCIHMAIAR